MRIALVAQFGEEYGALCRSWAAGIADGEQDR